MTDEVQAGRACLARADWAGARGHFETAGETPAALEGLADSLLWLGEIDAALERYERAFALCRRQDPRAAARIAIALAIEYAGTKGEAAVANGWIRRARRLLEGLPPGPEHAWLDIWEGHLALLIDDDVARASALLREGIRLSGELGLSDAEMLGTGLEGLALIAQGEVDEGMRRLDEATTAAVSGEMEDVQAISNACCYVLRACEQVQDFDRAVQWCQRARELYRRLGISRFLGYCRSHYVSVLVWRGAWQEAEAELEDLSRDPESRPPRLVLEVAARLGELRRRQGRMEEAAALFARSEAHPIAALGRAALALDQGDPATAVELAERYLRRLPEDDRIQRAPGQALLVRGRCALGRLDEAGAALAELRGTVESAGTEALTAALRMAEGTLAVAKGDLEAARRSFEDAAVLYDRGGAPFEGGRARLELAATLRDLGRPTLAAQEARAAKTALERVGAAFEAGRALALLQEEPASGLTTRQLEVLRLVALGMSNREIGERLHLSELTVKRHVADILTRLGLPSRAAAAAWAARQGLL